MLRGYVDRLDVAPGGALRVVDYKTGRSPSEHFEAKALFQMKFYALVLWRQRGIIPKRLQLVYLGNSEIVAYEPDEQDLLGTERKVKALWAAIERAATTGDWRPNNTRLCDWCDHKALCPAWGGTPPPLPEDAAARASTRPSPALSRSTTDPATRSPPYAARPGPAAYMLEAWPSHRELVGDGEGLVEDVEPLRASTGSSCTAARRACG